MPREMITAYATLKKAAANANHAGGRLDDLAHRLIVQVCDEILVGLHHDMFPLHVWMTGSGTQFNMTRRHCALGSKTPVPPTTMEHVAIVERHVPLSDAHRCRGERDWTTACRPSPAWATPSRQRPRNGRAL
jgi:hypothetical protein